MIITYGTVKNTKQTDKPNEDSILCDCKNGIFLLLDGVSRDNENGKYPNPSPAVEAVNILKEEIYKEIMLHDMSSENILDIILYAIIKANDKVKIYNDEKKLAFAAGAVGIVAIIHGKQLFFAYIGDCYGRLIYSNEITTFTECQTQLISQHKKEYSTYEIREIICNNIMHPYAYGVLNGDKRIIQFIKYGKIDLEDVKHIILTSDGMENYLEHCSIKILQKKDADELLTNAQKEYPTKQDDRSIIKIDLENDEK